MRRRLSLAVGVGAFLFVLFGAVSAVRASDSILCAICRAYNPGDLEYHIFMCAACPPDSGKETH